VIRTFFLVALLVGCGEQPDFVTTQGIDVFLRGEVDPLVTRSNTSLAVDLVYKDAARIAPKLAREVNLSYLIFTFYDQEQIVTPNGVECLAYDNDGHVHFAAESYAPCPFHSLAHEFGHVMKQHGDGEHTDGRFFNSKGALEQVAKVIVDREVCGLVEENQ